MSSRTPAAALRPWSADGLQIRLPLDVPQGQPHGSACNPVAAGQPRLRRLHKLVGVSSLVLPIGLAKLLVHHLGLDMISVNPLVSAWVASPLFLLG